MLVDPRNTKCVLVWYPGLGTRLSAMYVCYSNVWMKSCALQMCDCLSFVTKLRVFTSVLDFSNLKLTIKSEITKICER